MKHNSALLHPTQSHNRHNCVRGAPFSRRGNDFSLYSAKIGVFLALHSPRNTSFSFASLRFTDRCPSPLLACCRSAIWRSKSNESTSSPSPPPRLEPACLRQDRSSLMKPFF